VSLYTLQRRGNYPFTDHFLARRASKLPRGPRSGWTEMRVSKHRVSLTRGFVAALWSVAQVCVVLHSVAQCCRVLQGVAGVAV